LRRTRGRYASRRFYIVRFYYFFFIPGFREKSADTPRDDAATRTMTKAERERKILSHRNPERGNRSLVLAPASFIIIFLRALLLILHGGGAAKSVSLSRSRTRDPPPVGRESAVFAEFIESLPFRVARARSPRFAPSDPSDSSDPADRGGRAIFQRVIPIPQRTIARVLENYRGRGTDPK